MTIAPEKIFFLPGASGKTQFWKPVAEALETSIAVQYLGWPGFGDTPANEQVTCLKHLAALAIAPTFLAA